MFQTINFRKAILISISIYCIISVLKGFIWYEFLSDTFLIFPYFWHWSYFLLNSLTEPLILCQKNIFEIFCFVESLLECEANALAFGWCPNPVWTSLIIVRCRFVEEITSLLLLYINFPWSIVYKSFESWLFYLCKYVLIASNLKWFAILQNKKSYNLFA